MEGGAYTIFGLIIAAVVAVLIANDAKTRDMNAVGWGIFTFLVCIVAIPVYLIVRKPRKSDAEEG